MRLNLCTVPSCAAHNTELSKLDERFRIYIQAASDSEVALKEFKDTTFRGLKREAAKGFLKQLGASSHPARLNNEPTIAFAIDPRQQDMFFEKIIRGVYFSHFGLPFEGEVCSASTHLVNPSIDYRQLIATIVSMRSSFQQGIVTDDRVFRYQYGRVIEEGRIGFAVHGVFYDTINLFGFGIEK